MTRTLSWTADGWDDYTNWQGVDRRMLPKINTLIEAVLRDPFHGIGKPEPLKGIDPDAWSRRISQEHRLVYLVGEDTITIVQARGHY